MIRERCDKIDRAIGTFGIAATSTTAALDLGRRTLAIRHKLKEMNVGITKCHIQVPRQIVSIEIKHYQRVGSAQFYWDGAGK